VVKQSTHNPKIKVSNPAHGPGIEKMRKNDFKSNGREPTVNIAPDGSIYPG
jgi:hypothetical protein